MRVGLLQHALREDEEARLAGFLMQLQRGIHQHGGRHAVMVAQGGDVDARRQCLRAQVGDASGGPGVAHVLQCARGFDQAEDQVGMHPDVPRAQRRGAVPARRLRRLRMGEAAFFRVRAQVAVGFLHGEQVVGDLAHVFAQRGIAAADERAGRGRQPLAGVLAVPVAFGVARAVFRREQRDGRTVRRRDEVQQAAPQVGVERSAEEAAKHDGRRGSGGDLRHAASTTQRKPMRPDRSLAGAISSSLPCWSSRRVWGKYQCEVRGS